MLINSWRHYRRGFQPAGKFMIFPNHIWSTNPQTKKQKIHSPDPPALEWRDPHVDVPRPQEVDRKLRHRKRE